MSTRKKLGFIATVLLVFVVSIFAASILSAQKLDALSGSDFKPGRIIDDVLFYNGNSMTSTQIQEFLNAKVLVCDTNGEILIYDSVYDDTVTRKVYSERRGVSTPFVCLKDYKQDVPSKSPEDGLCNGITAGTERTAAQIIDQVSRSCGVSQKVLIVLLQKEQSLVTDDWPWPIQYRSATGYGCPDTAPCDEQYYGFFNQVYMAARVFKYYAKYPNSFNHIAGRNNNILYHPNTACGSSSVFIENQATAGLYNYTPYQPNRAALDNLYGTGDPDCSSYGNRNFWRMYNDWFGPTQRSPFFRIGDTDPIYMLGAENNYYHVSSWATMRAYGWGEINNTVSSYSNNFISGRTFSGKLPLVARFNSDEIYLMDKGLRRHFSSKTMLADYGYAIGDEAKLPELYFHYFRYASRVQNISRSISDNKLYLVTNAQKRHFTGPTAYHSGNPTFSSLPRVDLSGEFLSTVQTGVPIYPPGTLLREGSTHPVYVISNYIEKAYIPNRRVMEELGFSFDNVKSVSQTVSDVYTTSKSLGVFLIKEENGGIRFIVSGKTIYAVPQSMADPPHYNIDSSILVTLNNAVLSKYSPAGSVTELIRASGDKAVYKVESGQKRHVSSPSVLYSLGYTFDDVTDVSTYLIDTLPTGQPL